MNQRKSIIKRLKRGWCTGLDALNACGTMKLSTRVSELRVDGYVIRDKWVEHDGKRYKSYSMISACKATKKA